MKKALIAYNCKTIPLGLVLLEDLSLRVISDDPDVDEAAQVELFCSELRHNSRLVKKVSS